MALGIPNRLLILGLLAMAYFVPERTKSAGGAVQSTAEALSGSLSALGSTRIEPVFNPSIGLGGNIGSRIVSRAFSGGGDITLEDNEPAIDIIQPGSSKSEIEYVPGPFGPGLPGRPSAIDLITAEDYGN